jgi:hypothetical protein
MERAFRIVDQLRAALDGLGDALAGANLDSVLEAEARLADAVSDLPRSAERVGEPGDLAARINGVRAALLRCRRLGVSLTEAARVPRETLYTRDGEGALAGRVPVTVDWRG